MVNTFFFVKSIVRMSRVKGLLNEKREKPMYAFVCERKPPIYAFRFSIVVCVYIFTAVGYGFNEIKRKGSVYVKKIFETHIFLLYRSEFYTRSSLR